MRVISWNVNGLRAIDRSRRFRRFLDRSEADVVGVQEVRARPEQLPRRLTQPKGWTVDIACAERKGYSGVGLFSRITPSSLETSLGVPEYDAEGRVQIAEIGELVIANVYFPNGSGRNRDHSRVPFKLGFYRRLYDVLEPVRRADRPILVMGDFNTAHREVDLARPRQNHATSGFLPSERAELDRWLHGGYVDTFRARNSEPGHYTWWSQRRGVRARNIGWRIDLVLASEAAMRALRHAFIWPRVGGSDHCPVGVDLDRQVVCGKG